VDVREHAGDDTRGRIVGAARQAFLDQGIRRTSLDRVATAAGVHRATVHRLFPGGRSELVADVLLQVAVEAAGRVLPAFREAPDARSGVVELFAQVVLACRSDPILREAITSPVGALLVEGDRLAPLASFGMPWWEAEVESRAEQEGWVFDAGARGVDLVVRVMLSLVREPGTVRTPDDLRSFFDDFVVPVILHEHRAAVP
jgi:AcrR family transcriptional regulator